ncbi:hypothetical protein K8I61_07810 [bacterium]|nr:hypothetical protein [bacterium]
MVPRTGKTILRCLQSIAETNTDKPTGLIKAINAGGASGAPEPSVLATSQFVSMGFYLARRFSLESFATLAQRYRKALLSALLVQGGAGANGTIYLFDTQVALGALWELFRRSDADNDWRFYFEIADRTRAMIRDFIATEGSAVTDSWRAQIGPHLLKFLPYLPAADATRLRRLVEVPRMQRIFAGENPNDPLPAQMLLYGLEGLVQDPETRHWQVFNAATVLARHQNADGGIGATIGGERGPSQTDVTAQTVRVWTFADEAHFHDEIRTAIAFVDKHFDDRGARLKTGDPKRHVFATLYGLQATAFAEIEHAGGEIV